MFTEICWNEIQYSKVFQPSYSPFNMNPGTGNSFCGLYFRSGELRSSQKGRYIHRHPKRGTQIRDKEALVTQDEVSSLHTCKDTTLLCYYFVGSWTWIQDTNKGNNSIWWNTNEGFKSVPMFIGRISFFLCAQLWWDDYIYLCTIQNYSGISKCSKTCRTNSSVLLFTRDTLHHPFKEQSVYHMNKG